MSAEPPSPCCAPGPGRQDPTTSEASPGPEPAGELRAPDLVALDGGEFLMGSDDRLAYPDDGEGPVRRTTVAPFAIGTRCVTNDDFAAFVDATGFVTDAERYEWSFVFAGLLPDDFPPTRGVVGAEWWRQVEGSDWCHPEGPHSDLAGRGDHPVVHVSWNDATAYCAWAGARLPSEIEWEYAARGGLTRQPFPWGDELEPDGRHMMNVWQGRFPVENTADDGYLGTAPVDAYEPNGYGLYNTCGNVWEWTAGWFELPGVRKALRGGSYLCHASYCRRYRVSARMANELDASAGNMGFRVAAG